ncbi:hypothetical protein BYT27DRAFT_7336427 [Phlegmacium glaucopus]|nr:hypothetical protein BYT27DRAFT_7336427 [Phlegmacium glaucopus]
MAHRKLDTDDSEATAFCLDSERIQASDVSPTTSQFPEFPNTTTANPTVNPRPGHYPPIIPPEHSNRTLVLCFDGTANQFNADNSNVVKLVSLLKKDDSTKQMVYYQAGIGTYSPTHEILSPLMTWIKRTLDEMVGWSINAHVMDGYKFLMQNYVSGDKICLFGFSRGAYTARSLAGMLSKVGLLPAGNNQQIQFAYKMYTRADKVGWAQSMEFMKTFSVNVPIEFIGVWDTVGSLGVVPKALPVTTPCTLAKTFRHAISLDERRARFGVTLWDKNIHLGSSTTEHMEITDVEEVWFAGCHCDIGGGAVSNRTRYSLARIPLRWMVRECFKTNTGIMFISDALPDIGIDPSTLYPIVTPRLPALPVGFNRIQSPPVTPIPIDIYALLKEKKKQPNLLAESKIPFETEEQEELLDAMSPIYDGLAMNKGWWILEVLPFQVLQRGRGNDVWVNYFWPHMGTPRTIPNQKLTGYKVHRSVQLRKSAEFEDEHAREMNKRYNPQPQFLVEPTWVD